MRLWNSTEFATSKCWSSSDELKDAMPPPPPKGAPPAPMGGAPISASALAAIKSKAARIPRAQVEDNDESFADDGEADAGYRNRNVQDSPYTTRGERGTERDDKYYDDRSRGNDRDYGDEDGGDGYGDGYGAHGDEYDNSYGNDNDRVYDDNDARQHARSRGGASDADDYLNEVHEDITEDTTGYTVGGPGRLLAQPKRTNRTQGSDSTDPKHFDTPFDYVPPSRLPTVPNTPEMFTFRPILKATYRELRNFVLSPVEPGMVVRCYIERNRSGGNMMSPFYSFCADLEDGTGRELMVCKKVFYSMQSHHIFSLKGEDLYRKREQRSRLYLGKLRGNSEKTNFVLYDNGNIAVEDKQSSYSPGSGEDPDYHPQTYMPGAVDVAEVAAEAKDAKPVNRDDAASLYRKELCVINYESSKRPAPKGVRGSEIAIPSTFLNANTQAYNKSMDTYKAEAKSPGKSSSNLPTNTVPPVSTDGISEPFGRCRAAGMQNVKQTKHVFVMHERTSKYDPLSACLVEYKARANVASTKNCQLIESSPMENSENQAAEYEKPFLLQMGKTTDDCFNIDVKYPLSLLQAFAICITRFETKLNW